MILDRTKLKVMDTYQYAIQSINYAGMDLRQFNEKREQLSGHDLQKTMDLLPKGK